MSGRISPAVVLALAWATPACDVFQLLDVVPLPDAAAYEEVPITCDAGGTTQCECLPDAALVSSGTPGITALRIDRTYAYWIGGTGRGRGLYRAPLDGDGVSPPTLLASIAMPAADLALDEGNAYVVEEADGGPRILARVTADAGIASAMSPGIPRVAIDLSEGPAGLYWTDDSAEVCFRPFEPASNPADSGCGSQPLVPASTDASAGNHLAVAGTNIVLAIKATGQILYVPADGGAASPVPSATPDPNLLKLLAASPGEAFWTEDTGGTVSTIYGAPTMFSAGITNQFISALKADDTNVYFVAGPKNAEKSGNPNPSGQPHVVPPPAGRIYKAAWADGGSQQPVACYVHRATLLAVDPSTRFLVWADTITGEVRRVPK